MLPVSTPSSPNPLHASSSSSSRPTTPLLFRSSALISSSPLPPPCTPTFFSSVGDRSELFASPPRPRSADGGFAADAGFGHLYQGTADVVVNDADSENDADNPIEAPGSPVPSEGIFPFFRSRSYLNVTSIKCMCIKERFLVAHVMGEERQQ